MKRVDLTGKIFGRLKVISFSHSHIQPSKQKRAMWNVICDCGNKKIVSSANLNSSTRSCGCYIIEKIKLGLNRKAPGFANLNYKYISYKSRAKNHNKKLEFDLNIEEFKNIIINDCFYCGSEPKLWHTQRSKNGKFFSNGIDRINSDIGYIKSNCVACCDKCNRMKNVMEFKDFINHIKRILRYVSSKKRF